MIITKPVRKIETCYFEMGRKLTPASKRALGCLPHQQLEQIYRQVQSQTLPARMELRMRRLAKVGTAFRRRAGEVIA